MKSVLYHHVTHRARLNIQQSQINEREGYQTLQNTYIFHHITTLYSDVRGNEKLENDISYLLL